MKTMPMDNMTAHGMDHMPPERHSSGHMYHMNYFHFSEQSTILFAGWKTMTWGGKLYTTYAVQLIWHSR